jgi:uncharacterized protein involved in outer membrane biogenesis
VLAKKATEITGRQTALEGAWFNPYTLSLTLHGLSMAEADGSAFVSVERLTVNAQVSSLLTGTPTLGALVVARPSIRIVRTTPDTFNFSSLIPPGAPETQKNESPDEPLPPFLLKRFRVEDARIRFEDRSLKQPFVSEINPLSLDVRGLGSRTRRPGTYDLSVRTDLGTQVAAEGEFHLGDQASRGHLEVTGVALSRLAPYYQPYFTGHIGKGVVDVSFDYQFPASGDAPFIPAIRQAKFNLSDFHLKSKNGQRSLVQLKQFAVEDVNLEPAESYLDVGRIALMDTGIHITRGENGNLDILDLVAPPKTATTTSETPESGPGSGTAWRVGLKSLSLDGISATFTDRSAKLPSEATIGSLSFSLAGLMMHLGRGSGMPTVEEARLGVRDLRLGEIDAREPMIAIPEFQIDGIRFVPEQKTIRVAAVETAGGAIRVLRDKSGEFDLLNAVLPANTRKDSPVDDETVPAVEADAGQPGPTENQSPQTADTSDWNVQLERLAITGYNSRFVDRTPIDEVQAKFKDIRLEFADLRTEQNHRGQLKLQLTGQRDGTLSIAGDVGINPPAAELTLKLNGLSLVPAQPYFTQNFKILVTRGKVDVDGRLTLEVPPDADSALQFAGQAAVNGFGSVDKKTVKDFVRWESLFLSGIAFDLNPLTLRLEEVALTDYYARLAINADGSVNLTDVLKKEPPAPTKDAPAEATPVPAAEPGANNARPPDIRIDMVTLQGGEVDFSDSAIKPPFETEMLALSGTISGLSSEELARADVFLQGRLENFSPLKITGKINPLIEDQYTDIAIEFSDIDLSPMSPYTGKYLGRQLDKGKLTLILGYKISEKLLVGDNKVYLDQLTLGEPVDSPDATNLPVDLAISLLKDPAGRIELDLPVTGDLNDPEFSLGGVIVQLLVNTITKVITAPFAALGNMVGGGDEMRFVDFASGSHDIDAEGTEKLTQLATAMAERPAVNIEVQGEIEPEADSLALRKQRLYRLVEAEKMKALLKTNPSTPKSLSKIDSTEEFALYIKKVFDASDLPKPRNPDGTLKPLSPEEMEKLVFSSLTISSDDLRRLAIQRAEAARDFLLSDERLTPSRVFLREPSMTLAVDNNANPVNQYSRVNFAIKK